MNLPAPTRGTVVKVAGNRAPGAEGQGRAALLPGLEMARVNGAGEIRQGFGGWAEQELGVTSETI